MCIMRVLKFALPAGQYYNIPSKEKLAQRDAALSRKLAKRNAEGNIFLGMGKFITQKQKDEDLKNIKL